MERNDRATEKYQPLKNIDLDRRKAAENMFYRKLNCNFLPACRTTFLLHRSIRREACVAMSTVLMAGKGALSVPTFFDQYQVVAKLRSDGAVYHAHFFVEDYLIEFGHHLIGVKRSKIASISL